MATKQDHSAVPPAPAEAVLVSGVTAAGFGEMSVSWWLAEVKAGRAPQPVFRGVRCTRWRLVDVRAFWEKLADKAQAPDPRLVAMATKASEAAAAKRKAVREERLAGATP